MLVQDADLLGHLRIIKDFYLLGRGELYLAFIDQAQHLLRVPATANTEHGKIFLLLTHCVLVNSSTVICWMSSFVMLGVSGLFCGFYFTGFAQTLKSP